MKGLFRKLLYAPNQYNKGSFFKNLKARLRQARRADRVIPLLVDIIGMKRKSGPTVKLSQIQSEPNAILDRVSRSLDQSSPELYSSQF